MITLLPEALCFTIYLSQYPHKIFKFLFFFFMKALKFNKKIADVSISEKIQEFDNFSGSPEFDRFSRDLAIFRLRCNEQHPSIPKSQIKMLAKLS